MKDWHKTVETMKDRIGAMLQRLAQVLPLERIAQKKREIVVIGIALVIILIGAIVNQFKTYDDFTVQETIESSISGSSSYIKFKENLFRYSSDGAFYTDYQGNLIWSESYEMSAPTVDYSDGYILVYDKGGNTMMLFTTAGVENTIQTTLPLTDANIADNGVVAALMQENDTSYLQLYDVSGSTLASGELHTENSGYPVAIALSSDGEEMMVSMMNMNSGSVDTTINFYNFGSEGKDAIDNLVASFTYSNMVIPEIDFVKNDKAVAFGDTEIVIFSNAATPKATSEIYLDTEMKSIFYNNNYFGYISAETNDDGETCNVMTVYNMNGNKKYSRSIDISYTDCEMLSNNEVMLTNGEDVEIYTSYGIKKFTYTFDTNLYNIIPLSGNNYIFILNGEMESVKLK